MPNVYGDGYDPADLDNKADGRKFNAGRRSHQVKVDLAAGAGGTTNPIGVYIREGNKVCGAEISASVSLAGFNVSVGIAGTTAKYSAAATGPIANVNQRKDILVSALDDEALAAPEIVLFTPSANWPATGIVIVDVMTTKRG